MPPVLNGHCRVVQGRCELAALLGSVVLCFDAPELRAFFYLPSIKATRLKGLVSRAVVTGGARYPRLTVMPLGWARFILLPVDS